jgi:hypothetical protein
MTELIIDQHNTEVLSTPDNTNETTRITDHRIFSEAFLVKVSQCIKIANSIRTDVRSVKLFTLLYHIYL